MDVKSSLRCPLRSWGGEGTPRALRRAVTVCLSVVMGLGLVAGETGPAHASAPGPSVDYRFNGSLTDSAGGSTLTLTPTCTSTPPPNSNGNQCIYTSSFGADAAGPYWTWTAPGRTVSRRGGGFTVQTNSPLTGTYTLALKFSFNMPSALSTYSYLKIIDYQGLASDSGFYLRNGKINAYPPSNTGTTVFAGNQVLDLVVTRDDTTKAFNVYSRAAGGGLVLEFTYSDTSNNLIPMTSGSGSRLGFFYDDDITSTEATDAGKVYQLRTWNGVALTSAEIEAVTDPTANPTSMTDEAQTPPPWLQSYGRTDSQQCASGWHPSWAEWAVDKTGGWVCNRTIFWNGTGWSQNANAVWGSVDVSQTVPWDGS